MGVTRVEPDLKVIPAGMTLRLYFKKLTEARKSRYLKLCSEGLGKMVTERQQRPRKLSNQEAQNAKGVHGSQCYP